MRPAPGQVGDGAHLPWGSVRWALARGMRLAVVTHEGPPHPQYVALLEGRDTVVTANQLLGFVQADHLPDDLEAHARWLLVGSNELRPAP